MRTFACPWMFYLKPVVVEAHMFILSLSDVSARVSVCLCTSVSCYLLCVCVCVCVCACVCVCVCVHVVISCRLKLTSITWVTLPRWNCTALSCKMQRYHSSLCDTEYHRTSWTSCTTEYHRTSWTSCITEYHRTSWTSSTRTTSHILFASLWYLSVPYDSSPDYLHWLNRLLSVFSTRVVSCHVTV